MRMSVVLEPSSHPLTLPRRNSRRHQQPRVGARPVLRRGPALQVAGTVLVWHSRLMVISRVAMPPQLQFIVRPSMKVKAAGARSYGASPRYSACASLEHVGSLSILLSPSTTLLAPVSAPPNDPEHLPWSIVRTATSSHSNVRLGRIPLSPHARTEAGPSPPFPLLLPSARHLRPLDPSL